MADNIGVRPFTATSAINVSTIDVSGIHYPVYMEFKQAVAQGFVAGYSYVHKFGSASVGTTISPIANGGFYRTPTSPVTIAAISTSANDTAAGTGLREITIDYINGTDYTESTGTIAMNGTTESTDTISNVYRINRVYGSASGTYATQSSASQAGTITIREAGAGDIWAVIPEINTGFGAGQSLIGAYTVPAGKTAYILSTTIATDSTKSADFYFLKRENIDTTTAPYEPMRLQNLYIGESGVAVVPHLSFESYPEKTDIGYMSKVVSGTADVSVEFELMLVDN